MPLRWFHNGEEITPPEQVTPAFDGPATTDFYFPGGTAVELMRQIDPHGVHKIRHEMRDPTPEQMAEYCADLRDYVKRRREGMLWDDEEPPTKPERKLTTVFYRTGPPLF
jgi:hypothetical protein